MALVLVMGFSACNNTKSDIPEQYIEVIKYFQDCLIHPESMILYGDITVSPTTISFEYDAINKDGVYPGKNKMEFNIDNNNSDHTEVYDGEEVAKILGVEYYES